MFHPETHEYYFCGRIFFQEMTKVTLTLTLTIIITMMKKCYIVSRSWTDDKNHGRSWIVFHLAIAAKVTSAGVFSPTEDLSYLETSLSK